jgi:type VI secretion system protein ImpB
MSNSNAHKARSTGQKFIGRNRAPRVQIEYDVETYGAERKVEIPFVMGVIADLAGKSSRQLPDLEQRKFLDIDVDNFDDRLKSIQPRINAQVPNEIAGEGLLSVDLQFESMDDFSPASIARQVPALNQLLEARSQLSNLLAYIDGKSGAELLLGEALRNPALLAQLAALPAPAQEHQGAGDHASYGANGQQDTDPAADEPRA